MAFNHKLRFQCLPSRTVKAGEELPELAPKAPETLRTVDHAAVVIPCDDQKEGSCVARATCGLIECLIRMRDGIDAFAPGEQLDAENLYWAARRRFFGDRADEGLNLTNALTVAIEDFGLLPLDTEIIAVKPDLGEIVATLRTHPLIQAHLVGRNWSLVQPGSGLIPFEDVNPFTARGGHSTLCIGYRKEAGRDLLLLQNSWGEWGWKGLGQMEWRTWWAGYRWMMDGPYTVKLNPESWAAWNGWRKHVVSP